MKCDIVLQTGKRRPVNAKNTFKDIAFSELRKSVLFREKEPIARQHYKWIKSQSAFAQLSVQKSLRQSFLQVQAASFRKWAALKMRYTLGKISALSHNCAWPVLPVYYILNDWICINPSIYLTLPVLSNMLYFSALIFVRVFKSLFSKSLWW